MRSLVTAHTTSLYVMPEVRNRASSVFLDSPVTPGNDKNVVLLMNFLVKDKNNVLLPLILFLLTIITRIPFTSKLLYHMDSGHFALALEKYDITIHQPHPPGYFLYVMLGKLLHYFIEDANVIFVAISIVFSGLTIVSMYYLGKELYDKKIGVVSALIALTSPNLWFHGEVALSYIAEAFFSTAIALLCWRMCKGQHKYIWLSVIALGIAGGIRQNTMIFLFPLWLYSVRKVPIRNVIASLGLLGVICLLWFLPMVWMTGGWNAYYEAFKELWLFSTGHISVFEKGWVSFKIFSSSLINFTFCGIGTGMIVLALAAYSLIRHRRLKSLGITKVLFFSLWGLPSVLFYLFIFMSPTNPGYALIFLPTLFLLVAISIQYISDELKKIIKKDLVVMIVFVLIILNTFGFFLLPSFVSYRIIKSHDRDLSILLDGIKSFEKANTVIFVEWYVFFSYRHIMYYLPEYRVYQVDETTAQKGEERKIFWGVNRETFLSDEVVLPGNVNNFIIPTFSDVRDKISGVKGANIKSLSPGIFIASGPIELINNIYPELKIRFQKK